MRLKLDAATEYLKNNQLRSREEFVIEVTERQFDELHSTVKELRGRWKWIEAFTPDDDLADFLREVVRTDLQIKFTETFPSVNQNEWELCVYSRPEISHPPSADIHSRTNRKTGLEQVQLAKLGHQPKSGSAMQA